jgi:hypothetical protein
MTERAERPRERRRASKRQLRGVAWVAGGLAFAAPFGALAASPKPATPQTRARGDRAPVTVVRRITKRIVITHPAASAPVRYVPSAPSSSSSGGVVAAPAPPPPPTTSTGGS